MLLSGLFTLPVLLICAQPYDDSELRAFLTWSENCPAPCFMGIRPGVTTVEEAIGILQAHEWVQSVTDPVSEESGFISVTWRENASPVIAPHSETQLFVLDRVVYDMNIQTTYPVWTIYLLAGRPQGTDSGASRVGVRVSAYYFDRSMLVYAYPSCPVTQIKFWNADMYLSFSDLRNTTGLSAIDFAC
jgi:hypothetical protein